MPSFSANSQKRRIVFVVSPHFKLLDLTGPLQVFSDAGTLASGRGAYECIVASLNGGGVQSDVQLETQTVALSTLARKNIDTLLLIGGENIEQAAADEKLKRTVSKLSGKARRTGSICTGAFILAAAGLLDGKRAVTHWKLCAKLATQHPQIQVDQDPIFVKAGNMWTSAGVTAGIDLSLALVEDDIGRNAAMEIARDLVVFMLRPGGQAQFSEPLSNQQADRQGLFDDLHHWIMRNIARKITVPDMARRMNMSPRTFARAFVKATGTTPAKAVTQMRIEAARARLEKQSETISTIAAKCGFGDEETMRRAFHRSLKVSPSDYRERFAKS